MTFYNTTKERGDRLAELIGKAETQEDKVAALFEVFPEMNFTPFDVQKYALPAAPVTSARRAITNLTKAGVLMKTNVKQLGKFGRHCYTWKLTSPQGELAL